MLRETLLVTGGAGFIGCNFVRRVLGGPGPRVVVLDKLTYAGNLDSLAGLEDPERFRFVQGDIVDGALVDRLLAEERPRAIVNFAAESHVDRSIDSPRPFIETNIVGAFQLLESSRQFLGGRGASEGERFRLLHVSTDEVFGSLGAEGRFRETTPYAPNSPYAASKASADHLVRAYGRTYGLPGLITNCSNNFGPYQFPEKLIPLMLLNALDGRELPIYGDGGNVRDWLFVEDHCDGILAVLERGRPGESYNIGGGCERTNLQVLDTICEILERLRPAAENPKLRAAGHAGYADLKSFVADRPGHDRRYAINPTKIRDELDWQARHTFADAMETTVRWYLENGDWCAKIQEESRYDRQRLGRKESDA